jgi:hypothetical protein
MKTRFGIARLIFASIVPLLAALGTANAADQWFVLGEKVLKASDPSTEIKAEEGRRGRRTSRRRRFPSRVLMLRYRTSSFAGRAGRTRRSPTLES